MLSSWGLKKKSGGKGGCRKRKSSRIHGVLTVYQGGFRKQTINKRLCSALKDQSLEVKLNRVIGTEKAEGRNIAILNSVTR